MTSEKTIFSEDFWNEHSTDHSIHILHFGLNYILYIYNFMNNESQALCYLLLFVPIKEVYLKRSITRSFNKKNAHCITYSAWGNV